jgi:hypothetical protein
MRSAMGKDSRDQRSGTGEVYEVKMEGILDEKWSDWFNGMTIAFERTGDGPPITRLTGAVADQAKLRGMLSKIWDLNLTLISVIRLESKGDRSHS